MDFGDILDDWEKLSAKPGGLDKAADAERKLKDDERRKRESAEAAKASSAARESLASWLESHGIEDKDSGRDDGRGPVAGAAEAELRAFREKESRRLRAMKPEARIDLHGMTQLEAEAALSAFLEAASRRGYEKILVITGKGIHSQGEPILGKAARRVLEASPWAGRFGTADASEGGGGALWVLIRKGEKGDYFSR
jgi:DNA-nicking Smr family endonuclease